MVWTVYLGTGGKLKYMGQGRIKFIKIHFTFYWRYSGLDGTQDYLYSFIKIAMKKCLDVPRYL